jgi:hypothetical protein
LPRASCYPPLHPGPMGTAEAAQMDQFETGANNRRLYLTSE